MAQKKSTDTSQKWLWENWFKAIGWMCGKNERKKTIGITEKRRAEKKWGKNIKTQTSAFIFTCMPLFKGWCVSPVTARRTQQRQSVCKRDRERESKKRNHIKHLWHILCDIYFVKNLFSTQNLEKRKAHTRVNWMRVRKLRKIAATIRHTTRIRAVLNETKTQCRKETIKLSKMAYAFPFSLFLSLADLMCVHGWRAPTCWKRNSQLNAHWI